ncbi:nucleolar complex protein 4-like [Spatholobus suberectus]|nr:nucleolar complex protein 4-like [Spatholobus suberectus]
MISFSNCVPYSELGLSRLMATGLACLKVSGFHLSLHSFFLPYLPKLPSSTAAAIAPYSDDQSEFIYLTWLRSKCDEFLKSLVDVLASPQSNETLKELVLDTLMEFVKVANGSAFHSVL